MKEYKITWTIELDAESAADAAYKAQLIQQDPESTATVFIVKSAKRVEHIDLSDYTVVRR